MISRGRSTSLSTISSASWIGIERFHLAGTKIGGTIARAFAARRSNRVITLTVVGSQPPLREDGTGAIRALTEEFEKHGVEHWARRTMAARLGSTFPPEGVEWWTKFMGRTPVSSQLGFMPAIPYSDIRADVSRIACPTLIITNEENPLNTVEQIREGQQMIPNSTLLALPGDSHHVAASDAERCAQAMLEFISRNTAS